MSDGVLGRYDVKPVRAWQRMLSGRRLDLLNPYPADIEIEDIAHGLARVARWNGQTTGAHAFSVAQHASLVAQIAAATAHDWDARWRMAALLHDAAEYVIGDLISPFKTAIGLDYKAFEARLMHAVHLRFALPTDVPPAVADHIKQADRIAAYFEATRLAGFSLAEADQFFGRPPPFDAGLAASSINASMLETFAPGDSMRLVLGCAPSTWPMCESFASLPRPLR